MELLNCIGDFLDFLKFESLLSPSSPSPLENLGS